MALKNASSTAATSYIPFKEFQREQYREETVLARLIHFWEARNPNKGGMLMALQLLMIDQESTVMTAWIGASRIWRYKPLLKPGKIYTIKDFDVKLAGELYALCDHKFSITFMDQTVLAPVDAVSAEAYSIESHVFRIRDHDYFSANANKKLGLYDVVGQLTVISGNNIVAPQTFHQGPAIVESRERGKIDVHLALKDTNSIRVTLWEPAATDFRTKLQRAGEMPTVLLITTLNPKRLSGTLHINTMSSTRIFFDNEVDPSSEFLKSLGPAASRTLTINTSAATITKSEEVNIGELYEYLKTESQQPASFHCTATIVSINSERGWQYIGCATCSKKLSRAATSFVCDKCQNPAPTATVCYRVEFLVRDEDNVATFVAMDEASLQLFGRKASDLMDETLPVDPLQKDSLFVPLPPCLQDVVGKTLKFQVNIRAVTFTSTRKTFTVSRLIETGAPTNDGPLLAEKADTNNGRYELGSSIEHTIDLSDPSPKPKRTKINGGETCVQSDGVEASALGEQAGKKSTS